MTKNEVINAINSNEYTLLLNVYNRYKINKSFDIFFSKTCDKNSLQHRMLYGIVKDIFRKLLQSNGFDSEKEIIKKEEHTETKKQILPEVNKVDIIYEKPKISVREIKLNSKTIERPIIDSNPHVNRAELPECMHALYDENGRMNNEMKSMHAAMKVEPDIEKRKVFVTEVCNLEEKINKNWEVIDKWYQDFKSGIKVTEKKLDPLETNKKIEAAQKYMDRNFNSTKPKSIAKFNEYKNFLNEIGINYTPRPLRDNKRQKKK